MEKCSVEKAAFVAMIDIIFIYFFLLGRSRVKEERGQQKAEVGTESARSVHAAPGRHVGTEVPSDALPQLGRRRRTVSQTQSHRNQSEYIYSKLDGNKKKLTFHEFITEYIDFRQAQTPMH